MNKFLKLKEWVTLSDAANHLTAISNEKIASTDIVQFAIDGHIKLSLFLLEPTLACTAEAIDMFPGDPESPKIMKVDPAQGSHLRGLADFYDYGSNEIYTCIYSLLKTGKPSPSHPFVYLEQNGVIYELRNKSHGTDTKEARSIPENSEVVIRISELTNLQERFRPTDTLGTRERNNLLRCIAALLWTAKIDLSEKSAVPKLVNYMERSGYGHVSDDTARKWINDINNLLRKKPQ